ncbi:hypothetical protein CcaverHIS002_0210340 [Cutaneotrichosporon cavernicola]|uniref:Succinate dehydrogenase assembly factor 3 n=1 Tax=Cutaneotrichosporon cavernicola TaxID=279322 RepID=A0AA48KYR3_9TREE|nr:uncharacterized protein CcaverHIS019_0210360 [Cutaneotrichosporon cavernicola]BEJ12574.1 hypothetical protein CspHIS471_0210340 [Cutaneotrichosporon sp. HIS471]BEI81874.1 hypothetical protein CcaverHIS002_0210340 [Cutaneotrichosporon cavernicola]BEI89674.1 hypothetical protein CcaverHIS019_0210360 [Cutaneotrichosporon cavernicola]BEI97445.1 hypothetical protein CcaverHIS631_0210340 [Cutaneotrichosporon cavernicola]BEJ05223.1 hypothetical protein CcaverHIS641_0210400 [Cutaneotrichosporon cav
MIPSSVLRATAGRVPLSLTQASAQLIPPIPLYRRLLRVHRSLPHEMRFMGDAYVKSEFRATRSTDNPVHIVAFLTQWKAYLEEIERGLTDSEGKWQGRRLDPEVLDSLNNEQIGQLYEVMHAAKDVWKTPEQLEKEAAEAEARSAAGKE